MANEEKFFSGIDGQNRGVSKNFRHEKRSSNEASNATPNINSDVIDIHEITALAVPLTDFNVDGTPTRGQELIISIKDNGTARAITLGPDFEATSIPLPTTTIINIKMVLRFLWNVATSKWSLVSISQSSGGGGGDATLGTAQTFTALKTFKQGTADPDIDIGNTMYGWGGGATPSWGFNAYPSSGGWRYKTTNRAFLLEYNVGTGDFTLYNAPSGPADDVIAWTARQTINAANIMTLTTALIVSNGISGTKIDPRIETNVSTTSPVITPFVTDVFLITALAGNIATPITWSGTTPVDSQPLIVSIKDNGVARTLSWDTAKFESSGGATLPTTTVAGVRRDIPFTYNLATGKFRMLDIGDVSKNGVETLTNKRITPRISTEASNATPSINSDNIDHHLITALAVTLTSFTDTGTPTEGQRLRLSFTDDGTPRAITLGSNFEAGEIPLPVQTWLAGVRLDCDFIWNTVTSKWRILRATGRQYITENKDGITTGFVTTNNSAGASAATRMLMQNGTNNLFIEKQGTGNSSTGARSAGGSTVYNSGATVLALASDGSIEIYTGGITNAEKTVGITSAGVVELTKGQLKFPATANPSADANTLDDCEKGTSELSLSCSTSGTISISQITTYTKIGRLVTVSSDIFVTGISSPLGNLNITGLPFAKGNGSRGCVSIVSRGGFDLVLLTEAMQMFATIENGATAANVFIMRNTANARYDNLATNVQNGASFNLTISYEV